MNYRHSFHAGNFADIHKHLALLLLIDLLKKKDKPFLYLDTHGGRGRYDLESHAARETGEHAEGLGRLLHWPQAPTLVHTLLDAVRSLNPLTPDQPRFYPGSPLLAAMHVRGADRGVCYEAQDEEARFLERALEDHRRFSVEHADGWAGLRSKLPPIERRALVLIDPPYENEQDSFSAIKRALLDATTRFATGVFVLWFPIIGRDECERFYRLMQHTGLRRMEVFEMCVRAPAGNTGLNGSGLLVINPPYTFDQQFRELQQRLCARLKQTSAAEASHRVLAGE